MLYVARINNLNPGLAYGMNMKMRQIVEGNGKKLKNYE